MREKELPQWVQHLKRHDEDDEAYCGIVCDPNAKWWVTSLPGKLRDKADWPEVRSVNTGKLGIWCEACLDEFCDYGPPEAIWSGPGALSDIAIKGRCVIVDKSDAFWRKDRDGRDYRSEVLTDPTWEDLLLIADEVIETTGDWHHVFLEDFCEVKKHPLEELVDGIRSDEDPVRVFRLGLGS